ncbi:MAG: ABC transporter substrate-binding protein [Dongiaceae bacterium]
MADHDQLRWLASAGRMTRRDFMSRAAALGVSTALAGTLASKGVFADEAPKKGGHLILGLDGSASTDNLDPTTYVVTFQYTVGYQWGNSLVELTHDGGLSPELAESWEPDPTATKWVFKLRKGVQFHNGKEMTAEDVLATVNYHRSEKSTSPAKAFFEPVEDIKASDKHELTVTLKAPNADMPYIFADYHLLIQPAGGDPKAGIGTGGYIIETFEPGVRAIAKRNPNYWKADRAFVDSIETLGMNDVTARTSALQSGAVHFINRVDPKTVALLGNAPDLQVVDVPSAGYYCFPMRCDTPPYDSHDLRLALKYAIDRERMKKKIASGFGVVGNDHCVSSLDRFHAADIPQHGYDPDKAKFLYKKSGHSGALNLKVADAAFPGAVDAATLFKEDAAKAGIDIAVERVPDDGYWSDVWLKAPFCGSYWAGRPTADMMMALSYLSTAPWNESYWKRPDFDKLLIQARGELDNAKRKQMYRDLQAMISDDSGVIVPLFNNYLFGGAKNVSGLKPTPVFVGYRMGEQLHFD